MILKYQIHAAVKKNYGHFYFWKISHTYYFDDTLTNTFMYVILRYTRDHRQYYSPNVIGSFFTAPVPRVDFRQNRSTPSICQYLKFLQCTLKSTSHQHSLTAKANGRAYISFSGAGSPRNNIMYFLFLFYMVKFFSGCGLNGIFVRRCSVTPADIVNPVAPNMTN